MGIRDKVIAHAAECRRRIAAGKLTDLFDGDLRGADLSWADLRGADLSWANLRGADLSWAYLSWADLRGADLSWANLRGADLSWANLSCAYLREANLSRANLGGADLREANLREATLPDGRTWREYRADHLAGICDSAEVRRRAIAAWGHHQWSDCPMHEALEIDGLDAIVDGQRRRNVAAWVALYDAELLEKPAAIEEGK